MTLSVDSVNAVWGRFSDYVRRVRSAVDFIRANTRLTPAPFIPEIRLHLAADVFGLWERTEGPAGLAWQSGAGDWPPPFWAAAWAGGQALARYVLDHPEVVAGRTVVDLGAGSGLVAIAAARAGAARVHAYDVDQFAVAAATLNAEANGVAVAADCVDVLDQGVDGAPAEVLLAGDVFYQRSMADRMAAYLRAARRAGSSVLVGDPGRAYLPRQGWETLATYAVPTARDLEDADSKQVTVLRLR